MEMKTIATTTSLEIQYDDGRVSHYDNASIIDASMEMLVAKKKEEKFRIFVTTVSEVSMEEESN